MRARGTWGFLVPGTAPMISQEHRRSGRAMALRSRVVLVGTASLPQPPPGGRGATGDQLLHEAQNGLG